MIVVAHSQGGAIAHEAMQQGAAPNLFISVGSGLEKLEFLGLVRSRRRGLVAGAVAAPAFALGTAGLLAGLTGWIEQDTGWWVVPGLLAVAGYLAGFRLKDVVKRYRIELEETLAASRLAKPGSVERWCDVFSTLDMVPMGRSSLLPNASHIERVELRNECSFVTDHVTYFDSCCGFAAWCWVAMSTQSKLALFDAGERAALQKLGLWHARRAFGIGFGGGLVPLAVVFCTLVFTESMALMGQAIFDALSAADMDWTRRALEWLMTALAGGVGLLPGFENEPADLLRRSRVLLTAAISLLALALWALLTRMLWRNDGRARWRAVCRGTSVLVGPHAVWFGLPMVLFWCIFAMLPLLAVMIVSFSPEALTLGGLGRAMARVVALMLIVIGLFCGFAPLVVDRVEFEEEFLKRGGHFGWPLATAFGMGFYSWLGALMWSDGTGAVIDPRVFSVTLILCAIGWLVAVSIRYPIARWQLALSWAFTGLLAFGTVWLFGRDVRLLQLLPGCVVVLAIAGVLRGVAVRRGTARP
ncbi:hypothetical protein [Piscinibacter sakaiensis]|uniref:hypothetical protein n=1 Tax=Piscinibacter sakaiensis TaxID=1547922 RepID=UPI003AAE6B5B